MVLLWKASCLPQCLQCSFMFSGRPAWSTPPSTRMLCCCSPSSHQRGSKAKCRQTQTQWSLATLSTGPLIWCKDNPLCQRVERMCWTCHQSTQPDPTTARCSWGASVEEVASGLYNQLCSPKLHSVREEVQRFGPVVRAMAVILMTASFACEVQR